MPIELTTNLKALGDFQEIIESWVPKGKRITKIYEVHPHPLKRDQFYAHITTHTHRCYQIGMYVTHYRLERLKPLERRLKAYTTIDLLMHLAHELSHLWLWDHTPQRQIIECEITKDFMNRLTELGYDSEETEYSQRKSNRPKNYSIIRS